jgi:hypothetical protein
MNDVTDLKKRFSLESSCRGADWSAYLDAVYNQGHLYKDNDASTAIVFLLSD